MRSPVLGRAAARWLAAFAAFFLMGGAWALAAPYGGTPDEIEHVIRAAGVARGQVFTPPVIGTGVHEGAYQTVPLGLVPIRHLKPLYRLCYHGRPQLSAACGPQPGPGGHTQGRFLTGAGRYNPLYYAAVGAPLVRWPSWTGVLLARLISAALCAAFLASAWLSCAAWRRSPLLTGGLLVAATPLVFHLAGAVNPNSVEIAAGISLAAAAIPLLLLHEDSPDVRGWLRRGGVAAIAIAQFRAMGPLFAIAWPALLLLPARPRLRQLWRLTSARLWSAGAAISCVSGAAWTVIFKVGDGSYATRHYTMTQALGYELTSKLPWYLEQTVDGFGVSYPDTLPPAVILIAWAMALGVLLLPALAWGNRAQRLRLVALIAFTLSIPVVIDVTTVNTLHFPSQGRYIMPIAVGIPLLAAFTVGTTGVMGKPQQAAITRVMILMLLPFQLYGLGYVMDRWQSGLGPGLSADPLAGKWHPVTGSALPLLMMILGLTGLGLLAWRATRPRHARGVSISGPRGSADLDEASKAGERPQRIAAGRAESYHLATAVTREDHSPSRSQAARQRT